MAAMHFEQVQRFILMKIIFWGLRGTLRPVYMLFSYCQLKRYAPEGLGTIKVAREEAALSSAARSGNHGKQATVHPSGTCQHITEEKQCVECILTKLNCGREGGREKKVSSKKQLEPNHMAMSLQTSLECPPPPPPPPNISCKSAALAWF